MNSRYKPEKEFAVNPKDGDLAIQWKIDKSLISERDAAAPSLVELFANGNLPNA